MRLQLGPVMLLVCYLNLHNRVSQIKAHESEQQGSLYASFLFSSKYSNRVEKCGWCLSTTHTTEANYPTPQNIPLQYECSSNTICICRTCIPFLWWYWRKRGQLQEKYPAGTVGRIAAWSKQPRLLQTIPICRNYQKHCWYTSCSTVISAQSPQDRLQLTADFKPSHSQAHSSTTLYSWPGPNTELLPSILRGGD